MKKHTNTAATTTTVTNGSGTPGTSDTPGTSTASSSVPSSNAATGDDLARITNFTRAEIDVLASRFELLAPLNDKVDRSHFRDLLCDKFAIDDSLIMDRVFRCFDVDADNYITFEEFVKGMSVFLRGRFEERIKFCFRIYDLNGDRYISKEEMFQMLKNCLVKGTEEDEDGVKDLVDLILKKLDEDRDGRVSEADYITAVSKENLLLEAFGQCLPLAKAAKRYLENEALSQLVEGGMGVAMGTSAV